MKDVVATVEPPRSITCFRHTDIMFALFSCAAAFLVFLYTLAPTITFGDSGELITAAVTLGVAHPPGYPLWLILAKLFSYIPIGTVAYRLNLMTAILDAAAVGLLSLVISRTLPQVFARIMADNTSESPVARVITGLASAAAALCLAFSPTFWQEAVSTEVYALNNFLMCLILVLLVVWGESPQRNGLLLATTFLFGIGLGNHQTLMLLGPAIAVYVLLREPRILLSPRMVFGCLALFLLGLSIYIYLPIRASTNPPLNWGNPTSWESFLFHIMRKQYRALGIVRPFLIIWGQLKFFISSVASESLPVTLLLPSLLTVWFASKEGRKWLLFMAAAFVCTGVVLVVIANTELDLNAQELLKIYFLPPWIIVTVWVGYGIGAIGLLMLRVLRRVRWRAIPAVTVPALFVLLPVRNAILDYNESSMRGHDFGLLYGEELLKSLPQDAVLFTGTDSAYAIPMYLKWVEGRRPDISILSVNKLSYQNYVPEAERNAPGASFLTQKDYGEAFSLDATALATGSIYGTEKLGRINAYLLLKLFQRNISERPIYYDEGLPIEWITDFAVPAGLVMELKEKRIEPLPAEVVASDTNYWNCLEAKLLSNNNFLGDTLARTKFSKCRSNIGSLYLRRKMYPEAEVALKQAIRFSDRNIEAYAFLALTYKEQGRKNEAIKTFEEYLHRDTWNTSARAFAQSLAQ